MLQVWQVTDPGTHLVRDTLGSGERAEPHPQHTFPFQGGEDRQGGKGTPEREAKVSFSFELVKSTSYALSPSLSKHCPKIVNSKTLT